MPSPKIIGKHLYNKKICGDEFTDLFFYKDVVNAVAHLYDTCINKGSKESPMFSDTQKDILETFIRVNFHDVYKDALDVVAKR